MKHGYQIIEPTALNHLLATPKAFEITVALLYWLVELTRAELKETLEEAKAGIEVIRAEYHGPYPAIGVRYDSSGTLDLAPLVEATIMKILQGRAVVDLVSFLERCPADWRRETDALLGPRPSSE